MSEATPAIQAARNTPAVGAVLDTVYGRQQVMDVLGHPHDRPTVYLRPERSGSEWTVAVAELPGVLRKEAG
ncbi:hypothetical protein [Yinghuangia sp. YIM S09857]|uniref:hypothetical protein n=1 Tax=Yinghuangia sp. YIM S09857 TaxID=3436929 RepID=UPI003F535B8C